MGRGFRQPSTSRAASASALALVLLCSGAAVAALPFTAEAAPVRDVEWQALGVAPLSRGGATGARQDATAAVQAIDAAPERARLDKTLVLSPGQPLGALLAQSGAPFREAGEAERLVRSRGAKIASGTSVSVALGASLPDGRRSIERIALRAGLATNLEVRRGASGALELIEHRLKLDTTPLRIRGRAGDGLYWALRSAGASPETAAEYLNAIATQIDVGSEVAPDDRFDLVIASRRAGNGEQQAGPLLYAGLDRTGGDDLQLVRWRSGSRLEWVAPHALDRPAPSAMAWPTEGRITSGFGYRVHPILRFARMHRGVDFGASWGSPIVAAADGQVVRAGWAGGYGRQVRIAHADGLATSYSHMSEIVAEPGGFVRRGQLIGYVGSSGLSTGPHLHYEVYRHGQAVNPLGVRFAGSAFVDRGHAEAVKSRLKALLAVGTKRT